ncbi:IS3 family transposase [Streptomyces mirabilis]|uniref:IS3 family transposase n=1 Tax=Streptomyces mirabilis TaxID=68239 RepID=UPI00368B8C56
MTEKYEFIDGEAGNFPVQQMCTWAGVSTSGFYHWRSRPLSATAKRRAELRAVILQVFSDSQETYGYRRVHAALQRMNVQAGAELVRALMRELGLVPCQPRPWRATTIADDRAPATPDLLARDFTADAPGRKLVSDITYVHTWAGFLYLATVIDFHTKAVVGWAMADHMKTSLISDALDMAARNIDLAEGCIFHSDRGSQGGFNRSLQHLVLGGVDGQASRVDGSVDRAFADEVTRCTGATAGSGTSVLAGDREGTAPGGGGSFGRRIPSGGGKVVPPRWRHATNGSCSAVRPVPVLSRA